MTHRIVETIALTEAAAASAKATGRMLVQFIDPGWGASGYYSKEVLEAAATNRVIPKGTHMYADHPTATENLERPVRSVRDLVAVVQEDAYALPETGALVGEVQVVPGWQPFVETVFEDIGVSIRGDATAEVGEAEGRRGDIIEQIAAPVRSVDFVTRAGRGGRVLQLLESAASTTRATEHGLEEAAANDIRDALTNALRDAYGAEKTYVWVRDFDPDKSTVWFEVEAPDGSGLFGQQYTSDGTALAGDRTEVRVQTSYVPTTTETSQPTPAGRTTTTTQESEEDNMGNITIEESEHTRLLEQAGRATVLESERDTAVTERDQARAELGARRMIQALEGIAFSELEVRGLVAGLPLTEAGLLDEPAFTTILEGEVTRARESHARRLEEAGAGTVTGFGAKAEPVAKTDAQLREESDKVRRAAFGRTEIKEA